MLGTIESSNFFILNFFFLAKHSLRWTIDYVARVEIVTWQNLMADILMVMEGTICNVTIISRYFHNYRDRNVLFRYLTGDQYNLSIINEFVEKNPISNYNRIIWGSLFSLSLSHTHFTYFFLRMRVWELTFPIFDLQWKKTIMSF